MHKTAFISFLLALAVASAFATPAARKHTRERADVTATRKTARTPHRHASAASAHPSKAYDSGYRQGFAAGRAAALRSAAGAHCAPPAPQHTLQASQHTPAASQHAPQAVRPAASPSVPATRPAPVRDSYFDDEPASAPADATRHQPLADATFCRAEGSTEVVPCSSLHASRCTAGHCATAPAAADSTAPRKSLPANPPASKQLASFKFKPGAMPPPLRGSSDSLERQNDRIEADGLERILDERDLDARIARKLLVPIPASAALEVNPELPAHRRYCRPWTAHFLSDISRAHESLFHKPLTVSSAVRTVEYQKRLMATNGNAAPAEGDIVSPHLTGAAIDIPKEKFSSREIAWMRTRLLALQQAGKIDVSEEFQQSCFHIVVYRSYAPARPAAKPAAPARSTAKAVAPVHASEPRTVLASTPVPAKPLPAPQPSTSRNYAKPRPHAARPARQPASAEPLQVVVEGQ